MSVTTTESPLLSDRVRAETRADHEQAETSTFMRSLLAGDLDLQAYATYLEQYAWVYGALESPDRFPVGHDFLVDPRLHRRAAIDHDLAALGRPDWRDREPYPSTAAYVGRISQEGGRSLARFVAHHYTRYLGDLSGGQVIASMMKRHYGATDDQLTFFRFADIAPVPFKRAYRDHLNALPLSDTEIDDLVVEVRVAFRLNSLIFSELQERFA